VTLWRGKVRSGRVEEPQAIAVSPVTSHLEIRVLPGRVDVYQMYSTEADVELEKRLRELGLMVRQVFSSPCG